MDSSKLRAKWFLHLRQRNLSEASLRRYTQDLKFFEKWLGHRRWLEVDSETFKRYSLYLQAHLSQNTIGGRLAVLKGLYGWCYTSGLLSRNLARVVPSFRKTRTLPKNVPSIQEVRRLLLTPDLNTPTGYRDRTMMILTYAGALRRKELVGLELKDVDPLRQSILIHRKGGDDQEIPVGSLAMEYLSSYINHYRPLFNPKSERVFLTQAGNPLNGDYFGELVHYHSRQAGLKIHPHALRHAAATHMMKRGADIRAIQIFLGHKDIKSTEIYTRVEPGEIRGVIEMCANEVTT